MLEVTLSKRLLALAAIVCVTLGAAACTREKPAAPAPTLVAIATTPFPVATTPAPTIPVVTPAPVLPPTATETPLPPPTVVVAPPAVTPTPPLASAPSSAPGTYTVQWGDWFYAIARKFGVSVAALQAANPGVNPNRLTPGQVLHIPGSGTPMPTVAPEIPTPTTPGGPTTYTVQRGDWIYAIARKFGVSVAALQAANPGINPNLLYPGQVLNIPGGAPNPPPSPGKPGSYVVRPGDTLFAIAVRFNTTVYALQIANHLPKPHAIYPGQTLIIP